MLSSRSLIVIAALLALSAADASAHAHLRRSIPSAGAHLGTVPTQIRLEFSESPELVFSMGKLIGPDGRAIGLGKPRYSADSRSAIVFDIEGSLSAGTYKVSWQTAASDGHPSRGEYEFTIAPGSMGIAVIGDTSTSPGGRLSMKPMAGEMHHDVVTMPSGDGFAADSTAYVIIRWLHFLALLVIIGCVSFRQLVLGFLKRKEDPDSPMIADAAGRAARWGYHASVLLAATIIAGLLAQSYAMHGRADWLRGQLVGEMLANTTWGHGWLFQLLALIILLVAFHKTRRAAYASRWWAFATFGAFFLAFTPGFAGHASSSPKLTALAITADGFHVLAAGGWLGSLLMVVIAGIPAAFALPEGERGPMAAEVVNAFSPTALTFASIIGATGVFAAWLHVGSIPALWQTQYGKTLLVKLAILSIVAFTGAYNWLRVKPQLGKVEGANRIRRSAAIELAVGVLVVLVTAVLVALPTSADAALDVVPAPAAATGAGR